MIRPQIKIFGYSTIIYGLANLLTKIVSVALIPLYTNYLSVYDVGIIALFEMIEVFLVTFIPLGTITSMWRYLSDEDEYKRNSIIKSTFLIILTSGCVFIIIFNYLTEYLIEYSTLTLNENLIFYLMLSCFLRVTSNFLYWL